MDFSFTEAQSMLQTTVRRFVTEELIPLELEALKKHGPINRLEKIGKENYARLEDKGKDIGLWALWVPEEYGGAGLGLLEFLIVTEELSRTFLRFDFGGDVPGMLFDAGSKSLIDNYVLPCIKGEKKWYPPTFAQTEPNAGSDAAAIETTATKQGDYWVLNGVKSFITDADISDFALVTAVTEKGKGTHGVSLFIVDKETQDCSGYKVTRLIECMSGAMYPCELVLDNCKVPLANIVGKEGEGFILAQKYLEVRGRLHHAAWDLGMSQRSMELAANYAKQRVTFGEPLASRQAIQWMLADSALEIHAARWMSYHCAWKATQGDKVRQETAMVKIFCDEMVNKVVDRAIQIHGALGTTNELPLETFSRVARILRIGGGSMEMMRMLVARNVLRG